MSKALHSLQCYLWEKNFRKSVNALYLLICDDWIIISYTFAHSPFFVCNCCYCITYSVHLEPNHCEYAAVELEKKYVREEAINIFNAYRCSHSCSNLLYADEPIYLLFTHVSLLSCYVFELFEQSYHLVYSARCIDVLKSSATEVKVLTLSNEFNYCSNSVVKVYSINSMVAGITAGYCLTCLSAHFSTMSNWNASRLSVGASGDFLHFNKTKIEIKWLLSRFVEWNCQLTFSLQVKLLFEPLNNTNNARLRWRTVLSKYQIRKAETDSNTKWEGNIWSQSRFWIWVANMVAQQSRTKPSPWNSLPKWNSGCWARIAAVCVTHTHWINLNINMSSIWTKNSHQ